jgi:hypothetical protein
VGSRIDARKGRVLVFSATDRQNGTQDGEFDSGIFSVAQTRDLKPITELRLTEPLASCATTTKKKGRAAAAKKGPKKRRLWGDGKGNFRTKGKYGTATVVGTRWLTEDTCAGTRITVRRGVVKVREFLTGRTRKVIAGHSLLLRAPGKK